MMEKTLGKIKKVYLGFYDGHYGFHFEFSIPPYGVGTTITDIATIKDLMTTAKVKDFNQLANIPVEVTTQNSCFYSFRILEEVL